MRKNPTFLDPEAIAAFPDEARRAIYDVIALRRDVRHFREDRDVDEATLLRILEAAHQAPSVGLSQPWGFVLVRDNAVRRRIRDSFLACRDAESQRFPAERREAYLAHKLEGILEAPLNLCVAVDLRDRGEAILGTTVQPEAVRASACCAVENLWLAARAEGIGVGWVSIVEPAVLRAELALPPGVEPVAYLCIGHPVAFRGRPMLEETHWKTRRPVAEVIHPDNRWIELAEREHHATSASAHTDGPQNAPASLAATSTVVSEDRLRATSAATSEDRLRVTSAATSEDRLRATNDVASEDRLNATSAATSQDRPPSTPPRMSSRPPISAPERSLRAEAEEHSRRLTKPAGSLGRLEELAAWYFGTRARAERISRPTLLLAAADHGVVAEGVSAYGSQVTAAMIANVMSGGAAINALARQAHVEIALVDVGVAGDLSAVPTQPSVALLRRAIRHGTGNLRREPAMRREEAEMALALGADLASQTIAEGADVLALGEIGIGNTTAGAALAAVMLGVPAAQVVGRGTGISDDALLRKAAVVDEAIRLHDARANDPVDLLSKVGGLEIAVLVGATLESARLRVPVILDGFVTNAAALVARAFDGGVRDYLLASHASPEPGSRLALTELGLVPLFDWGMRLGEGTGAVMAVPILQSAIEAHLSMATFATAGIVGRAGYDARRAR